MYINEVGSESLFNPNDPFIDFIAVAFKVMNEFEVNEVPIAIQSGDNLVELTISIKAVNGVEFDHETTLLN
jgi:hypothetical protein